MVSDATRDIGGTQTNILKQLSKDGWREALLDSRSYSCSLMNVAGTKESSRRALRTRQRRLLPGNGLRGARQPQGATYIDISQTTKGLACKLPQPLMEGE